MKLDRIYIGFTNDGKERLLYRINGCYPTENSDVDCTFFYDLETKQRFDLGHVDSKTLKPAAEILNLKKRKMFKRRVVKAYKADRETLIDSSALFYGNLLERKIISKKDFSNSRSSFITYYKSPVREDVLFSRVNDRYGRVQEFDTPYLFYRSGDRDVFRTVEEVKQVNYSQFNEVMQPKRKILEMNYRKEL